MAVFRVEFKSEVLDLNTGMIVILPDLPLEEIQTGAPQYQTLWLLHGLSDDHTAWQRWTNVERYVRDTHLAVVMPAVGRSFYSDMFHGLRYWTYITEELPLLARWYFPLSAARADNFVAGLSMGGYGAFKIALSHPDRYAAAASLSGALDLSDTYEDEDAEWIEEMTNVWGGPEGYQGTPNDILYLVDRLVASKAKRPRLYQWCGTEDFLYDQNVRFREHARAAGLRVTYREGRGDHTWGYWDEQIQKVIAWLPLR